MDEELDAAPTSATAAPTKTKIDKSKRAIKRDTKTSATKKGSRQKTSADVDSSPAQIRTGSKQAKIVALLQRPKGATLDDMIEATDWLLHTTRAALTGLRKRGLAVERIKDEGRGSVYRITSASAAKTA